ncbi:MAG: flagellar basal body rod protein FlgB [Planctomycetota bacterium]
MELYGPHSALLMRMMSTATERSRVIAGNIANQNTPGFKRQTIEFESLLTEELRRNRPELERVKPERQSDRVSPSRPNGNNVAMEREVAAMRENLLRYEMYSTIMRGNTNIIQSAINGDR